MFRRGVLTLLITAVLPGCTSPIDTTVAEAGVERFHIALNSGNFLQIYLESSDDLKQTTPQKDFLDLLSAVHRKLGATKGTTKQAWKVNMHTSGTYVELTFKTNYERGEAVETFIFRVQSGLAALAGYQISSHALIVN